VYLVRLEDGKDFAHELAAGHGLWFQLIQGAVETTAGRLDAGDAVSSEQAGGFTARACGGVEALLFDFAT
jgi:redox-sensitive bicupin YhaK (pirin superfamily)